MKKLITLLALLFVTIISYGQTNYYSTAVGDLDLVTSWGLNTDGSGANPTNFTTASQVFNIRNRATATIGAAWTVSGGTSKIIVGDGTNACNFTIPNGFPVTGTIDVSAAATLTIQDATNPTLGTLNTTSTVVYDGNTSQTIAASTYGNLALSGDHGGGTITLASGTITLTKGFTVTATNIGGYSVTGNTFVYSTNTNQTVGGITYNNLTCSNTTSAKTAAGNITVNGALSTASGGTLAMSTFTLSDGGSMTVTNNGTISTSSTNNPAIPSGKTWTGTTGAVTFGLATGGQFIPAGSYKALTSSGTSGTNTVLGDLNISGTFTIGNGGTVDLGTNAILTVATFTLGNNSVLKTQNLSATPIPSGKTIGGTVNYNAATGGQTVVQETSYRNLTLGNTSGTSSPSGDLAVSTLVTTTVGGTLDMGTFALSGAAAVTNGGTIKTQNNSGAPFTTGKTYTGGTVEYNGTGAQTIVAGTYTGTLLVSGGRGGAAVTFETGTVSVSGTLSITASNFTYSMTGNTINYSTAAGGKTIQSAIPYNNLTSGNTSGINTADGNLTVNGTLTTTTGGSLDFSTFGLALTPATITNNGTIRTASLTNPALPLNQNWTGITGAVLFTSTSGGQSIPYGSYKTLTCSNTSGTNTVVGGDLNLTGVLTTSSAGGTLDMGANALISSSTITNTGTILTQNSSSTPLPTGKTWAGTVNYNGTGAQTIMAGSYTTLALSGARTGSPVITLESGAINVSADFLVTATGVGSYSPGTSTFTYTTNGANVVGGITYFNFVVNATGAYTAAGNVTVNGSFSITSGTLAMSTFTLDGAMTSVTLNGSLSTASTNNPALPTGKNWSGGTTGLVSFTSLTGGQFIPGGTYKTLTCANTSGTNTVVGGDITMTGVLTTSAAGGTLDMGTNALASSSTITNTGTIKTQNTSAAPLPTGKTWVGTVEYNSAGNQTLVAGTFTNMVLSGDHGAGTITLESGNINISNNFNVTATNIGAYTTTGNTFTYTGNNNIAVGGITYNNLTFSGTTGTKTVGGPLTVDGALSIASNVVLALGTNQMLGSLTGVTLNGTITTACTANPAFPTGKNWSGGTTGLVSFTNLTGGHFIPGGTYKTLTCANTSGTNTVVGGNITMTGVLTTSAAGGTLDMGTNALATSSTITNTGTIATQNTSGTPLPTGLTWGGIVNYNAASGGQTIVSATSYATLTLGNTSGSQTSGAATLTVNTALNTTAGGTLDMQTNSLAGTLTTITNNGIISTDVVGGTPFTTGKTWGGTGTVRYNLSTGGQNIMAGTYNNNLTLMNSSGTNTATGSITANATLTTTAGGTFDFAVADRQLLGATMVPANSGTIQTVCSVNPAIPASKTWGGTVIFNRATGGQSIPAGTYNNLTLGNTSGITTAVGALQVDGALVTTDGGTLAMVLNQLTGSLSSVTHNGTLTTTSVANPAIPTGKDWSGTGGTALVNFAATTGNQFVPGGTYKTLTCSNTSNTNTVVGGDITMTGVLTTSAAGGTLDMGTNALASSSTVTNTGTIRTQNTSGTPLPTGQTWAGIVNYNAASGGQTIVSATSYATLTLGNTSGTQVSGGATLTVNTALNVTAGGTLDMQTNSLAGTLTTITNNGTISTDVVGGTPFTTGKTWGGTGTVRYNLSTGGQNIMAGTYTNNLTLMNTSGTNTATGSITANATLTTTAGGTFDFAVADRQLLGATMVPANSGTIQTVCSVNPAIPTGKTWGGTVIFNRATGGQSIPAGTYNNLTFSNTSGTITAVGALQVDGALVTTNGGTLAMVLNQLTGSLSSLTHNGTLTTTSVANPAIPTGKDWSGTGGTAQVTFAATTGNQFIPAGTYKTLVCSNTSNTNTANGDLAVTTGLTTTAGGTLDMGANLLTGAFTPTNGGTIATQNTTSNPIPSGKTWTGTINYNGTGAQTMVTGTFTNLALSTARSGSPTITLENGNINVSGNFNVTATGVGSYSTGTNTFTYTTNANNTVGGITYNNLAFTNTTSTKTAGGHVTVNGTLSTASGGTFAMSTFTLSGITTVTNNGTITTSSTNNPAIPASKDWTGTTGAVTFGAATGGQFIPLGNYKTLSCSNTSNTNTVVGSAGILTITGTFTTNGGVSGSLDMGTNAFTATTITNTGTILTQCLSSTPIPTGKTIAGTVNYNAATGGQTVVTETAYSNLSVTNSSGTSTANGNIVANGTLTTGSGTAVFDLSTFTLTGNGSFAPAGGGTIQTQNSSAAPIKTAMTWTQAVEYNRAAGGQTIMNGTYNGGLTNSNTSGTNTVAAAAAITVNGPLTLTAGSVLADNNLTITVNGNIAGTGTHNTSASGKISMTGSGGTISGATLGNLTLNNAGGFSLTGSPTVNGTLTLTAGRLTLGGNNLILGTAAPAVAGTPSSSNMIVATSTGQIRKLYTSTGSYVFPIGDATPNYSPITVNVTSGTAGGGAYVGTNVSNTKEPNNANTTNYLNRYWGVSVSGFTTPVYSLTASYVAPTDVVGTETSIAAGQYTGALPWVKFAVVNDVAHTFSATSLSSTQSNFTGISSSNPLVSVLPTTATICSGFSQALDASGSGDPTLTYTWAPSTGLSATTGASVVASPTTTVTTTIVYTVTITDGNGITATATSTVTVNPAVDVITGTTSVCETLTTPLNNATGGGTWSSSNLSVATVGSADGIVTGVAAGTATISYIVGAACYTSTTVTVNTQPGTITGTAAVCVGFTTPLGNSVNGGTWVSSNTSKATVGSSNGLVTGVASGLSQITYALSNGCYSSREATVNANPAAITGTASVCETFTTALVETDGGGAWSTSNGSIATVGTSGIVTGVLEGNATISYIFTGTGCYATRAVTVNNQPGAITGSMAVCIGSTSDIDNVESGGTWVSSSLSNVTVDYINGILTGVAAGNANITYTLSNGCYATAQATANTNPSAITGTAAVCEGFTTTLNDVDGGGTWSSANNSTATVGSATGVVTGVLSGVVNISYTFTGTGCYATKAVTVITSPGAITGTASVCVSANTTLGNSVAGGTWSSSTPSIATVGSSSGVVTGVAAGNATISYEISAGCYVTIEVTVNPLPNAGTITGTANLNAGASFAFSSDGDGGGTWSASNANATVSPVGLVTGVSLGSTTISYAVTNGCGTATATYVVNTNTMALSITGAPQTCVGYTTQLSHAYTGGTWSSSSTGTATVGSATGIVTGVAFGNVTITYHANSTFVTVNVLVNSFPPPITGSSNVCVGFTSLLSHATAGGTWESSNVSAATVGTSGLVTGVASGVTVVTYTINSTCHITKSISVYDNPVAITGSSSVCQGSTIALSDATPTGLSWSSSNTAVGTIATSGVFRGLTGGTTTITYTTTVGCYATKDVTVNAIPTISGTATVCATFTTTLTPSIVGGTWASSSPTIASVGSSTGIVTGVGAGTARMTYTPTSGCIATQVVTVSATPAAITGTTLVCIGNTVTLASATPSCTWSSSTPAVASIGTSGIVTGVGAGTTQISYTNATGCRRTTFVTVNAAVANITGTTSACAGLTSTLADATPAGVWSGSNPTIATINSSGLVTGVSAGTINVSYTLSAGCKKGTVFTVNALPATITGTNNACIGFTSLLSSATLGGTWSSSNASIASVGSGTGVVTAVAAGTITITYTAANTCRKTATFTSKTNPASITGVNFTCVGAFCTLFCPSGSGLAWSSSTPAVGTVNSISGDVTGISAGTTTITFTNTSNCFTTRVVTVSATPDGGIVTGPGSVTTGNTISFSAQYSYGAWTTSDAGVATVSETSISTADVTGVTIGAATITYTVNNGCGSAFTTVNVNVPSRPGIHGNGGGSATTSDGKEISFYPNPTSGDLTLVAPEAGKFYIVTIDGKQVAEFDALVGKTKIEMPKKLAAGTYMCRYMSNSGASVIIRIVYEP